MKKSKTAPSLRTRVQTAANEDVARIVKTKKGLRLKAGVRAGGQLRINEL